MGRGARLALRIAALVVAYAVIFLVGSLLVIVWLDDLWIDGEQLVEAAGAILNLAGILATALSPVAAPAAAWLALTRKPWWTFAILGFFLAFLPAALLFFSMAERHGFENPLTVSLAIGAAGAFSGYVFSVVFGLLDSLIEQVPTPVTAAD